MGWDGAGGYIRQHNFSADASVGIKILAASMDEEFNDLASAITLAWARNGQNVPTQAVPMGGQRFINVGAATSVGNYMRVREFVENVPIFMQDQESSADRISVSAQYFTSVSANQAPGDGTRIIVRANSNKSSAVLYLNGHSANVQYPEGNRVGPALASGGIYDFIFSSVDVAWKIQNSDPVRGYTFPERFGVNATPGVTVMTAAVQAAIDSLRPGDTLWLSGTYAIDGAGLNITNKTDITIAGPGKLILVGAAANAIVLKLVGVCDNVRIKDIEIEGEALTGLTALQYGIYNNSGQTLSNIWVTNCYVHDLNSGINFNADTGGTYTNAFCLYNRVDNCIETEGGQGYGCFASNVSNMHFVGNTITRCQRHSIYIAKMGTDATPDGEYSVQIRGNIIREHRTTIASGDYRPAIFAARGFGGLIDGNYIIDFADGAIGVSQDDTDQNLSAGNLDIINNVIAGAQNANASILVGEQLDPTSVYLSNVRVKGNRISYDISDSTNGAAITVSNGLNVTIEDNVFNVENITAVAHRPIQVGQFAAAGATDLDNLVIRNNRLIGSGTANKVNFVFAFTDPATLDCRVIVKDNFIDPTLYLGTVEFQTTQTNEQFVYDEQGGELIGLYADADTTPSVWGGAQFLTIANTGATVITDFDDGVKGQRLTTYMADGNTTFDVTGTSLNGGSNDITPASGDLLEWINVDGASWVLRGFMDASDNNSGGA